MSTNYRIVTAEGGSLPTIVDANGKSVLAIDQRRVNGRFQVTPTFANLAVAERVLSALSGEGGE